MCNCSIVQCFTIRVGLKPIEPNPIVLCITPSWEVRGPIVLCITPSWEVWGPNVLCITPENNWSPHLPRRCYTENNWSPHLLRRCYTENNWSPHLLRLWLSSLVTHFKMTYFFLFKAFINEQYFSFFLENNNICCM
jgi:hypothetical protein